MKPLSIRSVLSQSGLVQVDASVLMAHVVGRNRAWLIAHGDDILTPEQAGAFFALAKRRRDGEPVAYLTGTREFWGLLLAVSPAVLIPRPETETLVEVALAFLPSDRAARVLDLGTGSGAVALAIAHERPHASIVATDIAPAALELARENAQRHGIGNVTFVASDWYAGLPPDRSRFDVIVSNPPYVDAADAHLQQGDLRHEPAHALTPGADALLALRRIILDAPGHIESGGCLAVEHGYDQADAARALFATSGFAEVHTARDLAGIPRVTYGRADFLRGSEGTARLPASR